MNNDDTLISKLIAETCTDTDEQEKDVVDLRKYFEKRLNEVDYHSMNDYLDQNHLSRQSLSFQNNSKCYRMFFKQSTLDFPSNWSVFAEIKNECLIFLDQNRDQDFLLDIFSELCGSYQNVALVKESDSVQLVFLPEESSYDHIKWMRNYFEKKSETQKTAA